MIAQVTAHTHEATHTHKPHALKLAAQGGGSKCASSRRSSRALPPVAASTVKLHIPAEHFHFKVRLCGATAKYIQRKGARESSIGCSRRRRKTDTRPGRARGELPPRPASGACAFTVKFSHTQGTSARVFVTNFFDKRYGNMSRAAARGRRAFGIQADRVRLRETPRAKARRLAALDHRLNAQRRRSLRRSW